MKLILLLLVPAFSYANIVTGTGQAKIRDTVNTNTACIKAESHAIENALLENFGKEFTATKSNYCFDTKTSTYCDHYRELNTNINGTIKRVLHSKTHIWNGVCFADVTLEVQQSRFLDVSVKGRNIYKVGDKLQYDVSVKEPFFMYVFNLHRKGVEFLFPHDYNIDNLVNEGYEFPGNGKKYVMYLNDGMRQDEEVIMFVFTKHQLNFDRQNLSAEIIEDVINSIPSFSKRVVKFNILVRK